MRLKSIGEIPRIAVKVLVQAIRRPWTVLYPREKRVLPLRARGRHLHFGGPGGFCIGCGRCSRICPTVAITNHRKKPKEDSYITINYSRCIYCGYCVDQCRNSALFHLPDYNLSVYAFDELKVDEEELGKVDPEVLERLRKDKAVLPEDLQEALDQGLVHRSDREKIKWRSKDDFAL
ncbi:MAG: 4Fe-4S binding protein [Candidatus Heimdallarchaeota archaeon]